MLKYVVKPGTKNVLVPFEDEKQIEVLTHDTKMTLGDLYDRAETLNEKCYDSPLVLSSPDTVYYDSAKDMFSFVSDDGVFSTFLTKHSKSQMCNRLGIPARYLTRLQAAGANDLASESVNTLFSMEEYPMFLRMYQGGEKLYLRGMLTPAYSPFDTVQVLDNVIEVVDNSIISDYKIKDYTLSPERFHLRMTGPKLNIPGEDLYSGIQIDSSDVGKSRLSASYLIYKLVCKNGLMIAKKDFNLFDQVHRGITSTDFMDKFKYAIERLPGLAAYTEGVITDTIKNGERYNVEDMSVEQVKEFTSWIKLKTTLPDKSIPKVLELMAERYTPTRWGLINSITEVAQDFTLTRRLELEKLAGDMLLVS